MIGKCKELLEKIERTYALCLRRCLPTQQVEKVEDCLVDCMKVVEPVRLEYLFNGCDERYLPL